MNCLCRYLYNQRWIVWFPLIGIDVAKDGHVFSANDHESSLYNVIVLVLVCASHNPRNT
jgi:hypothetical protein